MPLSNRIYLLHCVYIEVKGFPIPIHMLLCLVWIGSEPSRTSNARCREIFDMFDETVCGGSDPEVKGGKPAPDVFLVTAKRLSADPAQCLVLEDAANGAAAAAAAGMQGCEYSALFFIQLRFFLILTAIQGGPT